MLASAYQVVCWAPSSLPPLSSQAVIPVPRYVWQHTLSGSNPPTVETRANVIRRDADDGHVPLTDGGIRLQNLNKS